MHKRYSWWERILTSVQADAQSFHSEGLNTQKSKMPCFSYHKNYFLESKACVGSC